jgi:hypothetical protein
MLNTKLIIGGVAAVVVVVVLASVLLVGKKGSEVKYTFTPSTVRIGENSAFVLTITNRESGTMTVSSYTFNIDKNNQLVFNTSGSGTGYAENTIPAGQTVYSCLFNFCSDELTVVWC